MGTVICDNEGAFAPNLGGNTDFFVPSSVFALLGAFFLFSCRRENISSLTKENISNLLSRKQIYRTLKAYIDGYRLKTIKKEVKTSVGS